MHPGGKTRSEYVVRPIDIYFVRHGLCSLPGHIMGKWDGPGPMSLLAISNDPWLRAMGMAHVCSPQSWLRTQWAKPISAILCVFVGVGADLYVFCVIGFLVDLCKIMYYKNY